jgi:hypothetical protein
MSERTKPNKISPKLTITGEGSVLSPNGEILTKLGPDGKPTLFTLKGIAQTDWTFESNKDLYQPEKLREELKSGILCYLFNFGDEWVDNLTDDELVIFNTLNLEFKKRNENIPVYEMKIPEAISKGVVTSLFVESLRFSSSSARVPFARVDFRSPNEAAPLDFKTLACVLFPKTEVENEFVSFFLDQEIIKKDNLYFAIKWGTSLNALINKVFASSENLNQEDFEHLKTMYKKGLIKQTEFNRITMGMVAPEFEAFMDDFLGGNMSHSKRYGKNQNVHPLLSLLRVSENKDKLNEQIIKVLGKDLDVSPEKGLQKVFDFYAAESPIFKAIKNEEEIGESVRKLNAKKVNRLQISKILANIKNHGNFTYYKSRLKIFNQERKMAKEKGVNRDEIRYLNLYPRYKRGNMNPFELSIVAKTVDWYIKNNHSRLFSKARLLSVNVGEKKVTTPWNALWVYRGLEVVESKGESFGAKSIGANTLSFTYGNARDFTNLFSIPIVSPSTAIDTVKLGKIEDRVVFKALFDRLDPHVQYDSNPNEGVQGDITGLINETLRSLRELESKELERVR